MKKIHWFTIQNLPKNLKEGDSFEITEHEVINQIQKVLKLKVGESIFIKNYGFGYSAQIEKNEKKLISILIQSKKEEDTPHKIGLLFCIPKKDKFELILEKCTEIGITDFYPLISDRTIKTNINFERASKIIQEASEQAETLITPTLHPITKLDDVLDELKPIVFDTEGEQITSKILPKTKFFLIGPEGGFSERELKLFKEKSIPTYKIGANVLKTETAAIVISSLFIY